MWARLFILSVTLLFKQNTIGQNNIQSTGSNFTSKEATEFLAHHNLARKEFNIPPLEWDASISSYAQEWAEYLASKKRCRMIHRDELNKNPKNFGENLFWVSEGSDFTPVNASALWYDEKSIFEKNNYRFNESSEMGHYTQMIWKNTTHVGAGYATCPSGAIIVVANYNPPGNYIGSDPF